MIQTTFKDYTFYGSNEKELKGIVNEVFKQHVYYFETESKEPVILDIGAHVGVTTIYFKSLYPNAKITAVEPLPANYELLLKNLEVNQINDVLCLQLAVSTKAGKEKLYIDDSIDQWYSTASFTPGAWNRSQITQPILVDAVTLDSLLKTPIDLLKLDIEGAEDKILSQTGAALLRVKHLILEHHPINWRSVDVITKILDEKGFSFVQCFPDLKQSRKKLVIAEYKNRNV